MEVLLRGKALFKTYTMGVTEIHALSGVSFEIYAGEFLVILGPSGSGKSTFLNILGGMDVATSGELYYRDKPLHGANRKQLTRYRQEAVGFVFQFYNLMPNLTALENVDLAREISASPLEARIMLEQVGLSDRADHFPAELSGGQQQRVAIARALCKNPDILLCDEPTGALDSVSSETILRILKNFSSSYGKTVVLITHNASIAEMADRVMYIKDGKIDRIEGRGQTKK
ncbi:MAG: ABC transporter ATP-binding protein [Peptostreptococcaceae bacterium]|nr:ABC transporter ATP-binding protein [Peptostreptococcaceae bacterium]